jgi:hypothetical protein
MVESVRATLAEHPPLAALRMWFLRLAELVRVKHGLGEALQTAAAQDVVNETYAPVTEAIQLLLRACEHAGDVRPGLAPDDVLLLMGFLWRTPEGETGDLQARRVLDLAIAGLR